MIRLPNTPATQAFLDLLYREVVRLHDNPHTLSDKKETPAVGAASV